MTAQHVASGEGRPYAAASLQGPPQTWREVTLDDVAYIRLGRTPARDNRAYWEPGLVPWVAIADLDGGAVTRTRECISRLAHEQVFRGELVAPGTLLLSFKLTIGKVGVLGVPAVHNEAIASLTLMDSSVDRDYLLYVLQTLDYSAYMDTYVKGKTLNKDKLKSLRLVLPPLPEQRAIAHALRTVQDAIQARRREVDLERERKAALMQHLFTYGTRGEPTKVTEIGEMPESWQVAHFAEIVDIVQGQVDPREEPYCSMPHVGPENIEEATGKLLPLRTARELGLISGKYMFTTEHVLYSKIRPYLRKAALPNGTGICSADMYPLRPRDGHLLREFLLYILLSEQFTKQATAAQDRTGIPKVNRNQLSIVKVPVPPIDEQGTIAAALGGVDARIRGLEKEAALLDELFRALLEKLMTGRLSAVPLVAAEAGVRA